MKKIGAIIAVLLMVVVGYVVYDQTGEKTNVTVSIDQNNLDGIIRLGQTATVHFYKLEGSMGDGYQPVLVASRPLAMKLSDSFQINGLVGDHTMITVEIDQTHQVGIMAPIPDTIGSDLVKSGDSIHIVFSSTFGIQTGWSIVSLGG